MKLNSIRSLFLSTLALGVAMGTVAKANDLVELKSNHTFQTTVDKIEKVLTDSGMTIFAKVDHKAAAEAVNLKMQPATVLIYGNPKGGTPLMLDAPSIALDLPLRVLITEKNHQTVVNFHDATSITKAVNLPDERAKPLKLSAKLIEKAIK